MFETHLMQDIIDKAQGNQILAGEKHPRVAPRSFYEYKGGKYSIRELAKMAGISQRTMSSRFRADWSIEKAMSTPTAPRRRQERLHV